MATFAQKMDDIKAVVDLLDTGRTQGIALITKVNAVVASLRGEEAEKAAAAARAYRRRLGASLEELGHACLDPHLTDMARVILSPDLTAGARFWDDLRKYMVGAAETVKTRGINYGAGSVTGTGNGVLHRLTVNENGKNLEAMYLGVTRALCIQDKGARAEPGREAFTLDGKNVGADLLDETGARETQQVRCHDGSELIGDASFESFGGTVTVPTDMGAWETNATPVTDYRFTSDDIYRKSPEERANVSTTNPAGIGYALWLKNATEKYIQQRFFNLGGLKTDRPLFAGFAYRRDSAISGFTAGSGTLTPTVGNATFAPVVVAAQVGWQFHLVTLNENLHYRNLNDGDPILKLRWAPSAGHLLVDGFIVCYFDEYNKAWLVIRPGTTDFKLDDTIEFTDALAGADGKMQAWAWRLYKRMYHHATAGAETVTDP